MQKNRTLLSALALQIVVLSPATAQTPMRILYPNEVSGSGQGWGVDPHAGALAMTFPIAIVPGEIPIPVAYRFNGSHATDTLRYEKPIFGKDGSVDTRIISIQGDRPIFGSVHFGYITGPTRFSGYSDPILYVLEDGTRYRDDDFTYSLGAFGLPPLFNLGGRAATSVRVNSAGTLAIYDATLADLGTWATKVSQLAPMGYGTLNPAFKVVMDRDRARIFQYIPALSSWAPILWVDRFGHSVSLQWQQFTTNLPSTVQNLHTVKVLNQRNKGLQLQWAIPAAGVTGVQDLLRLDFIAIQAPSLQIKGYAGLPTARPVGMTDVSTTYMAFSPQVAGPIGRPKELRVANPANLTVPVWLYAGLPRPAATTGDTWASDLAWTFNYDANLAELTGFTDPLQVATTFFYQSNTVNASSTSDMKKLRGVTSANSVDGQNGTTLNRSYAYALPSSSTGTWVTTATQGFSPATEGGALKTEYTFAGPADVNYGNGALTKQRLLDASGTQWWMQTQGYKRAGLDATLSVVNSIETTPLGGLVQNTAIVPDLTTGAPKSSILQVGTTYRESVIYTFEKHLDLLDPARLTAVGRKRTAGATVSTAPTQKTVYNAAMLPSQVYSEGESTGQMGQNLSYYTVADGLLNGHLKTASNYSTLTGGIPTGVATQTTFLDAATGLPSSVVTAVDGQSIVGPDGMQNGLNDIFQFLSNYNSGDRPRTVVDAKGVTTTLTYDTRGRVLTRTPSGQGTVQYGYPDERTRTVTWNGTTVTETLDGFGRLLKRERPDGVTENAQYDASGRRTYAQEINALGTSRAGTTSFDPLGRVVETHPPLGTSVTYAYVASGDDQKVTATHTGTNVSFSTQQFTDAWGQTVKSVDPLGTVTTATYDAMGHMLASVANGVQTRSFEYNPMGLLTTRKEPETGTTSFSTFNALGLPTVITEAVGTTDARIRTLAYDGLGRLLSAVNGSDSQTFLYAGAFLDYAATTSGGLSTSVSYAYNPASPGQLKSETVTLPGGATWTIGYGYDTLGRMNALTYPSGRTVGYGFDALSRVNSVSTNGASVATIGYDDWGYRKSLTFASGAADGWTTDTYGLNLKAWSVTPNGGTTVTRTYEYDGKNDLKKADLTTGGEWGTLTHDNLGRLTTASGFGTTNTLTHDAYGNNISTLTTGSVPSTFNAFTFNPLADNRIPASTTNPVANTYWSTNARGEATSMGALTGSPTTLGFTWDGLGRLKATTKSGATQTYGYLPSGMRFQLTDSADAANNRRYAYTSGGMLLGEYTGSGSTWAWKRDVIYLGSEALAEVNAAGTHELHNDHLGTPRVITSRATGAVEGTQAFDAYGQAFLTPYTNGYVPLTGYTGHVQADTTGLIYMRGRFYSPAWHRFINSDQGVDPNSWNQMAYVGGSPFMATDPSGMDLLPVGDSLWYSPSGAPGSYVFVDWVKEAIVPLEAKFVNLDPARTSWDPGGSLATKMLGRVGGRQPLGKPDPDCVNGLKPLVLKNAKDKVGTAICGTGNCVTFFKSNMGNYATGTWVKGPAPNGSTPIGTWVATFFANGRTKFANESGLSHVGAWNGFYSKGIQLVDQYRFPKISEIQNSLIPWGGTRNFNNNASNYFTILVPCK